MRAMRALARRGSSRIATGSLNSGTSNGSVLGTRVGGFAFTSSGGGVFTLDPITTVKLTGTAGNFTAGQSYSFLVGTVPTGSSGAVTKSLPSRGSRPIFAAPAL